MNGTATKMMRRYATANGIASAGVCIQRNSGSVNTPPDSAIASDPAMKNAAPLPTTFLVRTRSRAPTLWPTRIAAAIPTPNTSDSRKCITLLAFDVAVSAASPR